ncbi:hypothetical protein [Pseudobacteriovorax antillogorgiicola]|uniref:Uncharacterized protein n=1 Tax=Pseudobacteriovorax antillogorgiicola TaxID=1513793 RepID=A0A1Y6CJ73_9BACT|nr:hypothetical protein [Pseudobacteriovorax antillogorgiicola]TCS46643.1 hypothetical protein EDD56_12319 [Pseudobacteriovorax antillogorgiicola]SMF66301.1 hypothetical protein SAMN06296036_12319 [Pseudobacteriovorax antillogorgiicola]
MIKEVACATFHLVSSNRLRAMRLSMNIAFLKKLLKILGLAYLAYAFTILTIALALPRTPWLEWLKQALAKQSLSLELHHVEVQNLRGIKIPQGAIRHLDRDRPFLAWSNISIMHNLWTLTLFYIQFELNVQEPVISLADIPPSSPKTEAPEPPLKPLDTINIPPIFVPIPTSIKWEISSAKVLLDRQSELNYISIRQQVDGFLSSLTTRTQVSAAPLTVDTPSLKLGANLTFDVISENLSQVRSKTEILDLRIDSDQAEIKGLDLEQETVISLNENKELNVESFDLKLSNIFQLNGSLKTNLSRLKNIPISLTGGFHKSFDNIGTYIKKPHIPPITGSMSINELDISAVISESHIDTLKSLQFKSFRANTNLNIGAIEGLPLHVVGHVGKLQSSDLGLAGSLTVENIFESAFKFSVGSQLKSAVASIKTKIPDLSSTRSLMAPILRRMLPLNLIPDRLEGSIDHDIVATVESAKELSEVTSPNDLSKSSIKSCVTISKFHLDLPLNQTRIEALETKLTLASDLEELTWNIDSNIGSVASTVQNKTFQVAKIAHSSNGFHRFDLSFNPKNSVSKLNSELLIGRIEGIQGASLSDFKQGIQIRQKNLQTVSIDKAYASLGSLGGYVESKGTLEIVNSTLKDLDASYSLSIDSARSSAMVEQIRSQGKIETQGTIKLSNLKSAVLDGFIDFRSFHLEAGPASAPLVSVHGLDGHIPYSQTINFDLSKEDYALTIPNVIQPSAKQLLSYNAMSDSFPKRGRLGIEAIQGKGIKLKDISLTPVLEQGNLAIYGLNGGLLDGSFSGALNLSFNPKPQTLDMRFTINNLNSHRLLEAFPNILRRLQGWSYTDKPEISGNMNLALDLENRDINGSMEITEIGKEQLKSILFFLDPEGQDPGLNSARQALVASDINYVSIPIKHGFLEVDIGLSVLAIPVPLPKMSGFPVSQIIANFTSSDEAPIAQGAIDEI